MACTRRGNPPTVVRHSRFGKENIALTCVSDHDDDPEFVTQAYLAFSQRPGEWQTDVLNLGWSGEDTRLTRTFIPLDRNIEHISEIAY